MYTLFCRISNKVDYDPLGCLLWCCASVSHDFLMFVWFMLNALWLSRLQDSSTNIVYFLQKTTFDPKGKFCGSVSRLKYANLSDGSWIKILMILSDYSQNHSKNCAFNIGAWDATCTNCMVSRSGSSSKLWQIFNGGSKLGFSW